jgi:hypothetical protein
MYVTSEAADAQHSERSDAGSAPRREGVGPQNVPRGGLRAAQPGREWCGRRERSSQSAHRERPWRRTSGARPDRACVQGLSPTGLYVTPSWSNRNA